jgi:regulator of cell morphogenesis and NO signaling
MIPETHLLLRAFARVPLDSVSDVPPSADPHALSTPDLIAHILERYHATHRREFPKLIALARRVEATHEREPECPRGLADHLSMMADDLEGHQLKEETVLFPMMLRGGAPMIRFPIDRMMAEHRDVDHQLEYLATLTHDFTPPIGACASWRELYRGCRKIDRDLQAHMRVENQVLFDRFL